MPETKNSPVVELHDREFRITRIFNAPRELVFKAWTDPAHMAQWWGPHHFTNPVCNLDVRPGGSWRIVMRAPDGVEHPAKGIYQEVVPPQRLVMTIDHSELPEQWHDLVNPTRDKTKPPVLDVLATITFEDLNGKTRQTVQIRFDSNAQRDSLVKIGMREGWSQSLERLDSLVSKSA
jgi:uncharacterized protein YndB with AHSA1/START domain